MSFQPKPTESLILWDLLFTGEEPAMSKAKPDLEPTKRKKLIEEGLIELQKRGRAHHILLTDKAWNCALEDFRVEGTKSPYAATALQHLLDKVRNYLESNDISLSEFFGSTNESAMDIDSTVFIEKDLEEEIRKAYSKASGSTYKVRVRLSMLHQYLDDLPRPDIDKTLIEMQRLGKITLMPLDNPQEIHPEDEQAAVDLGGAKRHILYMEG